MAAMVSAISGVCVALFNTFGNDVLLGNRQDVVSHPVQYQACGEPKEKKVKATGMCA